MKFTLSWLKDYLDTDAALDDISAMLTAIGLEVEKIEDPAKALQGFVVGHVVSAEKHPDADKLQCLVVDTGTERLKVVCGAPNAKAGLKGVFAPAGSFIPGLGVTLKKTDIRGQESNGMMCSERELLLSDEHNGIIELPQAAVAGSRAAVALGLADPVIEVNLTPNRGDGAGVYGIARDLAAAGLGTLKPPVTDAVAGMFKSPVSVALKDMKTCPLFLGRYIKDVKNGASPDWLQKRLKAVGQKPISALVDITNYFSIGLCRPLHVFDADRLKGNIHVRGAKKGEKLDALNDETYELDDGMVVVCDEGEGVAATGGRVIGLGGIIGGTSTAVDENTKNVYIECAYFDPATIAGTGQKLQIDSDARYRFERGIDPAFTAGGMELATRMVLDLCGGNPGEVFTAGVAPENSRTIAYKPEKLKTLGGRDLDDARQKEILAALGFKLVGWNVRTPSWRHDVSGAADIVEEILRIDGYDKIPAVPVTRTGGEKMPDPAPLQKRAAAAKRALAARGLFETVTWSFMDGGKADLFGANANRNKKALALKNPISAELSQMRPSILPNLIDAAAKNADRGHPDAALFEIGRIFLTPEHDGQPVVAAGVRCGNSVRRHWSAPARKTDALDAKGDALAALESCGVNTGSLRITRDAPEWYHPGRSGCLRLGQTVLAHFGEIHPAAAGARKRDDVFAGFEIFLDTLPPLKKKSTQKPLLKPSPFQPVSRDFAFIVDKTLDAEKLVGAVAGADKKLIVDVDIFDVYEGDHVAADKKSVAVGVTLQPVEKTLTDEDINAVGAKIVEAVKNIGGTLRE